MRGEASTGVLVDHDKDLEHHPYTSGPIGDAIDRPHVLRPLALKPGDAFLGGPETLPLATDRQNLGAVLAAGSRSAFDIRPPASILQFGDQAMAFMSRPLPSHVRNLVDDRDVETLHGLHHVLG